MPAMEKGTTVLVVVGYQLQRAVLEKGWPQSGRSIIGPLGQARNKDKRWQRRDYRAKRPPSPPPGPARPRA
eukprot:6228342-Pyramimonas_sp.AAC.1